MGIPTKTSCYKVFSSTFLGIILSSCTVGPNYVKPPVVVPPKFKEAKNGGGVTLNQPKWKPIHPQDELNRGKWWLVFNDPLLNELEEALNCYNQNIANAEANYRQALAVVDQARASYYPTLVGAFNLFRQKSGGGSTSFISSSGGIASTGVASGATAGTSSSTTTSYSGVLNATWEPDIWGLVRRTVEANVAAAESDAALLAATKLSQQGALAQYYFELKTLDKDQVFLDNTVKSYAKILKLTQNQYRSGVASQADIVSAQSVLESAQAQAINNGILRGQYEHAIAVLIGRPPAFVSLKKMPLKQKPPIIPVDVPSEWLERRPDISQAERLVQKTSAQIGVAIAAFFPSLTLTGSASAAGNTFHHLIHTPSVGWSTGLQLAQTIFDGGLRSATVRAAKAAYEAQIAAYRQTVLAAFQDVEDNLIALRLLRLQGVVQNKAAASANKALRLVINQYRAGTVAYSSVLTAQVAAFNAQKTANDVAGLQMTAAVGLIKALGGGWCPNISGCNHSNTIVVKA